MQNNFDHLINNGYKLSFDAIFGDTWKLFKKDAGSYIGYFLLLIVLLPLAVIGFLIPYVGWGLTQGLIGGFYTFARASKQGDSSFGNFFNGFKNYWQLCNLQFFSLVVMIPVFIIYALIFPWEALDDPDPEYIAQRMQGFNYVSYLIQFISLSITTFFSMALPLVVDRNMTAYEAMKTSFYVTKKKFWTIIGALFLGSLIAGLGTVFTCFLGFFVAYPYYLLMPVYIYFTIFDSNADTSDLEQFGTPIIDTNTEADEESKL